MKKIAKLLVFVGTAGAALAGLWYFIDTNKKIRECEEPDDFDKDVEEDGETHSYVNLEPADTVDKEALKKNVASAVDEAKAKAEDEAEGVGLVKEEKDASDFSFKSFDDAKEE